MVKAELLENIIKGSKIYGAIMGALGPLLYLILTIFMIDEFRGIYYLRFPLAIIFGAILGGFFASKLTSYALKITNHNLMSYSAFGFFFGAIAGILTLGIPSLVSLISSSDINWAIQAIIRSSIAGSILGSIVGLIFAWAAFAYVNKK